MRISLDYLAASLHLERRSDGHIGGVRLYCALNPINGHPPANLN